MGTFKPRTATVEAFQFHRGMKHQALQYNEPWEHPGGPPGGDDYTVAVGHNGQRQTVNDGEYVLIGSDGLCRVMNRILFEAIYEPI